MPRYRALCRFWSRHPPTHRLLAAWLGAGRQRETTSESSGDLSAFFRATTGGELPP